MAQPVLSRHELLEYKLLAGPVTYQSLSMLTRRILTCLCQVVGTFVQREQVLDATSECSRRQNVVCEEKE